MFGNVNHACYDSADYADIEKAQSIKSLADVALRVIHRLKKKGLPIGMVSAPISTGGLGCEAANIILFQAYIEALKAAGYLIYDQMPVEDAIWRIRHISGFSGEDEIMEDFYGIIFDSGLISWLAVAPYAETSYGARWENIRCFKNKIQLIPYYMLPHVMPITR